MFHYISGLLPCVLTGLRYFSKQCSPFQLSWLQNLPLQLKKKFLELGHDDYAQCEALFSFHHWSAWIRPIHCSSNCSFIRIKFFPRRLRALIGWTLSLAHHKVQTCLDHRLNNLRISNEAFWLYVYWRLPKTLSSDISNTGRIRPSQASAVRCWGTRGKLWWSVFPTQLHPLQ